MHNQHTHFWAHFAKNIYGNEVFAPPQDALDVALDQHMLFEAAVTCCAEIQDNQWGVRLFVDDNALLDGSGLGKIDAAKMYFPTLADGSFEGYHQRMRGLCQEYCLIINDPERLSPDVYRWSREFLKPIFKHRGMNSIGVYNALFVGNYKKTSFGVHFDAESVFHIPLIGKKAMRFWPAEYIQANPQLSGVTDYAEHLDASVCLSSDPGGFVYWPKKAWHIAESATDADDAFSVSMALSLQEYSDITPYIVNNLLLPQLQNGRDIHDQFQLGGRDDDTLAVTGIPFNAQDLQATATQIPDSVERAFTRLHTLTHTDQATTLWLKLLSAFGFTSPPVVDSTAHFHAAHQYHVDTEYPVLHQALSDNTRVVASNGHLFPLADSAENTAMLDSIASNKRLSGDQLLSLSEHLDTPTQQAFLNFLCATRAINAA